MIKTLLGKTSTRVIVVLMAAPIISACSTQNITLQSRFLTGSSIAEGTPVYFDNRIVGEVTRVESDDTGTNITVKIDAKAAQSISTHAAIMVNHLRTGSPLEIYARGDTTGTPLQDGQEITGLDSSLELGAWMLGDVLQQGSEVVTQYVDAFQQYLNSEQFAQDKEAIQLQIEEASKAASEALESVEREIDSAVEDMAMQEQAAAESIEQLGDELAPLVEELAKSGSQLVLEIEQFAADLERSQQQGDPHAGQQLLESLIAALEQLSASIERGAGDVQPVEPNIDPDRP